MSKGVLDLLNKIRTKPKREPDSSADKVEPGSTPKQDLSLGSVKDSLEQMEDFQKLPIYGHRADEDEFEPDNKRHQYGSPPYAIPKGIRKYKRKHPDYRAGKVKVYTREEIEQYEKERDNGD